jgi:hypothetical protein
VRAETDSARSFYPISLTPVFSPVFMRHKLPQPFQRLIHSAMFLRKPLKTADFEIVLST